MAQTGSQVPAKRSSIVGAYKRLDYRTTTFTKADLLCPGAHEYPPW